MIIGLNGQAGSGKDTVGNYLVEEYGFKRYAFADAVRKVALAINPLVLDDSLATKRLNEHVEELGWEVAKRDKPEVRRLLQVIGTEVGRDIFGENVWVDIVARQWKDDGKPKAVVTDMRFPNEWEWIHSNGWPTVKIVRPNNPNNISASHVSETYTLYCKYALWNDGTIEDLHAKVDDLAAKL